MTENLPAIVRKVTGIDALVDRLVGRLPDLEQAYIQELCSRVEELTGKIVNTQVSTEIHPEQLGQCLLVWGQQPGKKC